MTFRPLVVQGIPAKNRPVPDFFQQLNLTTLALTIITLRQPTITRIARKPDDYFTAINSQSNQRSSPMHLLVANPLQQPHGYEIPNPVRRKNTHQDFFNPAEVQLLGQDKFVGAAGQVRAYDWTNPVRPKIRNEFGFVVAINPNLASASVAVTGVVGTAFAGTVSITTTGAPLTQVDWTNPVRSKFNLLDFINPSETQLFGQDQIYGAAGQVPSYDWTNPVRPKIRNEFGSVSSYLTFLPIPIQIVIREPTVQSVSRRPTDYYTAINSQINQHSTQILLPTTFVLSGVVATASAGTVPFPAPTFLHDWPNPVLRKRTEFGHIDFMVLNTFDTFYDASGQVPNYDWTNPVRAKVRNEFGFIGPSKPFLIASPNIPVTGVFATALASQVLLGTLANITGTAGTASAGILSDTITSNISITGAVVTATVGTIIPNPDGIVLGVFGTATVGTIVPQVGAIISGVFGTSAAGSIILSGAPTAAGVVATATVGNLIPALAVGVTGVVGTTSAGTIIPSVTVSALGVVGTISVGAITPSVAPNITGVIGTASAGTILPSIAKTLTGAGASAGVGTFSFSGAVNAGVTGVVGTASAGTVTETASAAVSITGAAATATTGTATISTTASPVITGAVATASAGAALPRDNASAFGVVASAGAGTVKSTVSGIPSGVVATATVGMIASLIQTAIQGAQITTTAGTVTDIIQIALAGAQVSAQAGAVTGKVSPHADIAGISAVGQVGNISVLAQNFAVVANVLGVSTAAIAGAVIPTSTSYHIKKIKTQITVSRVRVDMT